MPEIPTKMEVKESQKFANKPKSKKNAYTCNGTASCASSLMTDINMVTSDNRSLIIDRHKVQIRPDLKS